MITRIQKWGNSLGVRIPKSFAEEVRVGVGSTVDIALEKGHLVVRRVSAPSYQLSDLLSRVTRNNLHKEITWGDPVGREVW